MAHACRNKIIRFDVRRRRRRRRTQLPGERDGICVCIVWSLFVLSIFRSATAYALGCYLKSITHTLETKNSVGWCQDTPQNFLCLYVCFDSPITTQNVAKGHNTHTTHFEKLVTNKTKPPTSRIIVMVMTDDERVDIARPAYAMTATLAFFSIPLVPLYTTLRVAMGLTFYRTAYYTHTTGVQVVRFLLHFFAIQPFS